MLKTLCFSNTSQQPQQALRSVGVPTLCTPGNQPCADLWGISSQKYLPLFLRQVSHGEERVSLKEFFTLCVYLWAALRHLAEEPEGCTNPASPLTTEEKLRTKKVERVARVPCVVDVGTGLCPPPSHRRHVAGPRCPCVCPAEASSRLRAHSRLLESLPRLPKQRCLCSFKTKFCLKLKVKSGLLGGYLVFPSTTTAKRQNNEANDSVGSLIHLIQWWIFMSPHFGSDVQKQSIILFCNQSVSDYSGSQVCS